MKKIPTLFVKQYDNHKCLGVLRQCQPGMEWVLGGKGIATLKVDGSAMAVIDGKLYHRYDAKKGKKPPEGAIPCTTAPDSETGHWPHWVAVTKEDSGAKWYMEAAKNTSINDVPFCDAMKNIKFETFEAVGPHFQGNPYMLYQDILVCHGKVELANVPRDYDGIRNYLSNHNIEGIVFWKDGEPKCKIRRKDFGFEWPIWPTSLFCSLKETSKD